MHRSTDRLAISLETPPATEPVSVAEAKVHARIDETVEDIYVASLIEAARHHVEGVTRRALITQTWTRKLDRFPGAWESDGGLPWDAIVLPRPPLQSVTSIAYLDQTGTQQTLDAARYVADADSIPGRVTLAYNQSYPVTLDQAVAVTVTYVAGYGDAATDVPQPLKQAIKLLVSSMYEHRELEVVGATVNRLNFAVDALLSPYIVHWF